MWKKIVKLLLWFSPAERKRRQRLREDRVVNILGDEVRKRHSVHTSQFVTHEVEPGKFVYVCIECYRRKKMRKFQTVDGIESHLFEYHGVKQIDDDVKAI